MRAVHNLNDVLLFFGGGGVLPVLCDVFDGPLSNLFGVLRTIWAKDAEWRVRGSSVSGPYAFASAP